MKSNRNYKPPLPNKSKISEFSGYKHNRSATDFKLRIQT